MCYFSCLTSSWHWNVQLTQNFKSSMCIIFSYTVYVHTLQIPTPGHIYCKHPSSFPQIKQKSSINLNRLVFLFFILWFFCSCMSLICKNNNNNILYIHIYIHHIYNTNSKLHATTHHGTLCNSRTLAWEFVDSRTLYEMELSKWEDNNIYRLLMDISLRGQTVQGPYAASHQIGDQFWYLQHKETRACYQH